MTLRPSLLVLSHKYLMDARHSLHCKMSMLLRAFAKALDDWMLESQLYAGERLPVEFHPAVICFFSSTSHIRNRRINHVVAPHKPIAFQSPS